MVAKVVMAGPSAICEKSKEVYGNVFTSTSADGQPAFL